MTIIVTGCAGFIGFHLTKRLLENNYQIIGIDNINDYYDIKLKTARLAILQKFSGFIYYHVDITDKDQINNIAKSHQSINKIVHLAAQAGVRYSLEQPFAYIDSNINGLMVILELCRNLPNFEHLVFASSSSVYGGNSKLPFSVEDQVMRPKSLYAATKLAGESMCYSYSSLYNIPISSLRFFTVYGPWNRPDMAIYKFTKAIYEEKPLHLYNFGDMKRDFTYVDDIVSGIIGSLNAKDLLIKQAIPYKVYNLGNHNSTDLKYFVSLLEHHIGKKAHIIKEDMQDGDMKETYADISQSIQDLGFSPNTSIEEGVEKFVAWYKNYHNL
jgi:UDP-glucuronate 4-epimerase